MAYVYFFRSGNENLFKIGKTARDDVEDRIRDLSTGNPHPLTVFDAIETEDEDECEKYLHKILRSKRSRESAAQEFFEVAPDVLKSVIQDAREFLSEFLATKRAAVWPSTQLGTYWSAWFELSVVRRLPRCVFAPRPSVDAGVLRIVRRPTPLVPAQRKRSYAAFLARGYGDGPRSVVPWTRLKKLEAELGQAVNMLGVGPQGLGGDSTAFAVHVETAATHITMNPVAVNMQCH